MIDSKEIYESHPLYNHFTKWMGLDGSLDDNYFMINSSLWGAEDYIDSRYNIKLTPVNKTEVIPQHELRARLSTLPSNILSIFTSNTLQLPTVNYFDTTKSIFTSTAGGYSISGTDVTLELAGSDNRINYVAGWLVKDAIDYNEAVTGQAVDTTAPNGPLLRNADGSTTVSPIVTGDATTVLTILGEVGSKIIVNEADTGNTIAANGQGTVTLTNTNDLDVYRIALMDSADNVSEAVKVVVVKSATPLTPELVILGHDLVTAGAPIKVSVYLPTPAELFVNGASVGNKTKGVHSIDVAATIAGTSYVHMYTKIGTTKSKLVVFPVMYSTSYDVGYVEEINNGRTDVPYIPVDLLIAVFRLAHHMYHGTLYKNDNIDRYAAGESKSVTFSSHSIPRDVVTVLHRYTTY